MKRINWVLVLLASVLFLFATVSFAASEQQQQHLPQGLQSIVSSQKISIQPKPFFNHVSTAPELKSAAAANASVPNDQIWFWEWITCNDAGIYKPAVGIYMESNRSIKRIDYYVREFHEKKWTCIDSETPESFNPRTNKYMESLLTCKSTSYYPFAAKKAGEYVVFVRAFPVSGEPIEAWYIFKAQPFSLWASARDGKHFVIVDFRCQAMWNSKLPKTISAQVAGQYFVSGQMVKDDGDNYYRVKMVKNFYTNFLAGNELETFFLIGFNQLMEQLVYYDSLGD